MKSLTECINRSLVNETFGPIGVPSTGGGSRDLSAQYNYACLIAAGRENEKELTDNIDGYVKRMVETCVNCYKKGAFFRFDISDLQNAESAYKSLAKNNSDLCNRICSENKFKSKKELLNYYKTVEKELIESLPSSYKRNPDQLLKLLDYINFEIK